MGRGMSKSGKKQKKKFGLNLKGGKKISGPNIKKQGILQAAREGYQRGAQAGQKVEDVAQEKKRR